MDPTSTEARIALFLDYENLAIGARDHLNGRTFRFNPVAEALAERGRVVVRRAYADWSYFDDDRRELTRHHVELVEIPQRMGAGRKNAADIKLAVDALELAFERPYISTYVIGTGDSDFTPLVHKLRELDKRVIGLGVKGSTSKLLPPACDEFLFYDRLVADRTREDAGDTEADDSSPASIENLVIDTLVGMLSSGDTVRASTLKRAVLRKDATFDETDHGFRGFTDLLRHLEGRGLIELSGARQDPEVDVGADDAGAVAAFGLLASVVGEAGTAVPMSGLKDELRRRDAEFSERKLGYTGFLQFCRAAAAREFVSLDWDEGRGQYLVGSP